VVFGPHPREYAVKVNAKVRRAALGSALTDKTVNGAVKVVEGFGLDAIRTKDMVARLAAWEAQGRVLLVLPARDEVVERSAANLREVRVILADSLNVVDLLEADTIVFTREALARAEEVYA
jgi:large subunit ribosomal protein L4